MSPTASAAYKAEFDQASVIDALKSVLPREHAGIPLHEPSFAGNEWAYVKECLDTGWVSSVGKFVDRFEQQLADYTGAKHAVAVVNGTAALHVCLRLAGVERDDEVLIPTLTFIATANAVSYCGAIPHFVDSEESSLGLDPVKLGQYLAETAELRGGACFNRKTGRRIKAVVPMHVFGHPVDLDALVEVCGRFRLELVEDAAESLGSYYKGRHTGNHGKVSALCFQWQQDHHHRRRRSDPDQRLGTWNVREAPDNYGQGSTQMVIYSRSDWLQLPFAQHQRGFGVRTIGAVAGVCRPQA